MNILFITLGDTLLWLAILLLVTNVILVIHLMRQVQLLYRDKVIVKKTAAEAKTTWLHLFDRSTTIPDQVMENHEYDGIKEYDNNPPAWFNWLFALTIIWGIGYFAWYEVFGIGLTQEEQYVQEMQQAEQLYAGTAESRKIDIDKVEPLVEETEIQLGQQIFQTNCVACHGPQGEGGTGPNLTDEYWKHGGDYKDIVYIVINGVPEKGMLAWEKRLKSDEILQVSSYIQNIRGTNVAGGKEPEGEKYEGKYKQGDPAYMQN